MSETEKLALPESQDNEDVILSICPRSHTSNIESWFPLFIPLSRPVQISRGDVITAHFWRCASKQKVWYEWCLSSPVVTEIQNSNGKSSWIGL